MKHSQIKSITFILLIIIIIIQVFSLKILLFILMIYFWLSGKDLVCKYVYFSADKISERNCNMKHYFLNVCIKGIFLYIVTIASFFIKAFS